MRDFLSKSTPAIPNRVLVADDDPVIRHLVTATLKQQDYEVIVAHDGREAFRILQNDSQFKAAIFDMTMPFLEGLDLVRYMRSEKRLMRIPIMMISAEQDIKLMSNSFSAGAAAFLPKPFTPEQLQNAIRMLLRTGSSIRRAA